MPDRLAFIYGSLISSMRLQSYRICDFLIVLYLVHICVALFIYFIKKLIAPVHVTQVSSMKYVPVSTIHK